MSLTPIVHSNYDNIQKESSLFEYHSYLDMKIDDSSLNNPISIDVAYSIPITIEYETDIPAQFDLFPRISNWFLFGDKIRPMQKIKVEVENPPDWVNTYISSPELSCDIRFEGEMTNVTTNLIISCTDKAPAESYKITIKSFCEEVGKLEGIEYHKSLTFTPAYLPDMEITLENSSILIQKGKETIIPIKIKNKANKISRIIPSVNTTDELKINFSKPYINIAIDETTFINISITPNNNFEGDETITAFFQMEVFPLRETSITKTIPLLINLFYDEPKEKSEGINLIMIFLPIGLLILIIGYVKFFKNYRIQIKRK